MIENTKEMFCVVCATERYIDGLTGRFGWTTKKT